MILEEFIRTADISENDNAIGDTEHQTFSQDSDCNMVITYCNLEGKLMYWDKPRKATQHQPGETSKSVYTRKRLLMPEKGQKYKGGWKQPNALFLNGLVKFKLLESSYFVIVEGEKKAFVACKNGIPAIGISGIHNAVNTNKDAAGQKERRLIEDFADFFSKTKSKKFILLFDRDCREGTQKRLSSFASAVINFKAALESHNKSPLWFAHIKQGHENGIDDLLIANPDKWARMADDLLEQELKSEYFSFVKLTGIKPRTINSYFLNSLTEDEEHPELYKYVQKGFWGGQLEEATLLSKLFIDRWSYNATLQRWMQFKSGKWHTRDNISDGIIAELGYKLKEIYWKFKKLLINEFEDFSKAEEGFIKRLAKVSGGAYLTAIAKIMQGMNSVTEYDCDTDLMLLNCKNGELNLETMELLPHNPKNYNTKQAETEYIAGRNTPPYLLEILNYAMDSDSELLDFWQQWAGICLTGTTDWQAFIYAYGAGANGKSLIAKTLSELLGDYAETIDIKIIMGDSQNSSDEYTIAGMKGARLVIGTEISKGYTMNESRIKGLTGGDTIVGRPIRGNPIKFEPTAKYFFFGNHKLTVKGQDEGIWRRIYMLEFDNVVPEKERISMSVIMEALRAEFPDILGWALEGLQKYLNNNRELPKPWKVKKSTEEYKRDNDTLAEYIEEKLSEVGQNKYVKVSDIYRSYCDFCTDRNEKKSFQSTRTFKKELKSRGYNIDKHSSLKQDVWHGVEFTDNLLVPIYGT